MNFSHRLKKNTQGVAEFLENSQVLFDSKCFKMADHSNDIKMTFFQPRINPEVVQSVFSLYVTLQLIVLGYINIAFHRSIYDFKSAT